MTASTPQEKRLLSLRLGTALALWRWRLSADSATQAILRFKPPAVSARLRCSARQLALAWLINCRSTPRGWAALLRILAHCSRARLAQANKVRREDKVRDLAEATFPGRTSSKSFHPVAEVTDVAPAVYMHPRMATASGEESGGGGKGGAEGGLLG